MLGKKIDRRKLKEESLNLNLNNEIVTDNNNDNEINNNYIENNYWINVATPENLDFMNDLYI
jgi:hypothetical protein